MSVLIELPEHDKDSKQPQNGSEPHEGVSFKRWDGELQDGENEASEDYDYVENVPPVLQIDDAHGQDLQSYFDHEDDQNDDFYDEYGSADLVGVFFEHYLYDDDHRVDQNQTEDHRLHFVGEHELPHFGPSFRDFRSGRRD